MLFSAALLGPISHTNIHLPRSQRATALTLGSTAMPLSETTLRARALALVTITLLAAGLLAVPAPARADIPVEGFPGYEPQTRCTPRAKPGTVMLAEHLLSRYPGSTSSGISRSCGASGVSEHKEGRAFDWGLDVGSQRDRGYARDLLERLRATDRRGNQAALARRMGVMYLIWNDRIWSSSDGYRSRPYLHSACRRLRGCPETLRHRDHMHISLSRRGARGKTSWYLQRSGGGAPATPSGPRSSTPPSPPDPPSAPDPDVLDLSRRGSTTVRVPVTGERIRTPFNLREGTSYTVTTAGLFSFGGPSQAADAVCTWSTDREEWVPRPSTQTQSRHGRLALLVDGKRILGNRCRPATHVYRGTVTPGATRPLTLAVPVRHRNATGSLTVVISRSAKAGRAALPARTPLAPAPRPESDPPSGYGLLTETVALDPRRARRTVRGLERGASYRVTVSGSVRLGGGVVSDGRCVSVGGRWYREASIDLRAPGADHGHVYLNGVPFAGRPVSGTGCGSAGYLTTYTAPVDGRLHLDLWDPSDRTDNTGTLTVQLQRLSSFATPRAARRVKFRPRQKIWKQPRDWFEVRSDDPAGTVSRMRLRKGEQVHVVVRGTQRSHGREADAACVLTEDGWQRADPTVALQQDPLELWVDGNAVSWRALGRTATCSEDEHSYVTRFTARKPGPLRLAVLDLDHGDNAGTFSVTLLRQRG
jgi:hypothetical protein